MHPFKSQSDENKGKRLSKMGVESKMKSAVHQHERNMHPGKKETAIKMRAAGGAVDGEPAKARGDRASRGKGTTVNVVVQSAPKPPMPMPIPVPVGGPPPGAGPMAGPPGGMPMPPPGAGGPPGLPPGMPMRKRGGSVKMDAGAGSGVGRIENAKMNAKAARTVAPQNRKRGGKAC